MIRCAKYPRRPRRLALCRTFTQTQEETFTPTRVRIGLDEVTVNASVGSRAYLCSHTDGSHSIIKDYPKHSTYPVVLFTDRKRQKDNSDEVPIVRL